MENQLDFYRSYHTHPINQNIHTVCIPAIVLCVLNYSSLIRSFSSVKIIAVAPQHIHSLKW